MARLNEFLTVHCTAELLEVSEQTIRNWCRSGVLRAFQKNKGRGRILVRKSDVDELLEREESILRELGND